MLFQMDARLQICVVKCMQPQNPTGRVSVNHTEIAYQNVGLACSFLGESFRMPELIEPGTQAYCPANKRESRDEVAFATSVLQQEAHALTLMRGRDALQKNFIAGSLSWP